MAKKSIENGEDCDGIPEAMRQYLAMQAMESGKGIGTNFLGRGLMPYGGGMLMTPEGPGGKVGKLQSHRSLSSAPFPSCLHLQSDPPHFLSIIKRGKLETRGTKHHGPDHLLLAR